MMKSDAGTNIPSPSRKSKTPRKSRAVQTCSPEHGESLDDTVTMEPVDEDKENKVDTLSQRGNSKEKSRFSSFYIDLDAKPKKPAPYQNKATVKRPKSVAWYEPYQYQPMWADTPSRNTERERPGLVRMTLQEALLSQHPRFVTNMKQRQRKITINAEERAMQEIWAEERERLFGNNKEKTSGKRKSTSFCTSCPPPSRDDSETNRGGNS
uniref:ALMS motif domain-containing protein n=1 Tax=Ciona savignyi TaxID=51511 RepID=H2YXH6_CIOSA